MQTYFLYNKVIAAHALALFAVGTGAGWAASDQLNEQVIRDNMGKVAEWQVKHPKHSKTDWTNGALYSGLLQYGLAVPEGIGLKAIREVGEKTNWGVGKRHYHADDHCVGHAWIEMAGRDGNPAAVKNIKEVLDKVKDNPAQAKLEFGTPKCQDRWCWSDALFMSPPSYAKLAAYTGDESYLKFMDKEYKATYDYLFDKKAGLFSRDSRYFTQKAANGKKMFWSRGNGWVIAGLPLILRDMPQDWPTRPFYENLLKTLAKSLKNCQTEDGSWHASLLDPEDPPLKEMSGTLFITYGLIWGVNNGLLDAKEYMPVIEKAWKAANECVEEDGLLGWVQPIADKPGHYSAKSTEVYGPGAYLLAGTELRKAVVAKENPRRRTVTVTNPLPVYRSHETISIKWPDMPAADAENLRVFDVRDGRVIPHQLVDENGDGKTDALLFQGDFPARVSRDYWVFSSKTLPAASKDTVCYSRYVPERMDDFAWENDVTAHRIYGPKVSEPAPKGEGLFSNGSDIWCKYGPGLVIDEFYKKGNYHSDHGKGLDMYKVGPNRGCGATAVVRDGTPFASVNWATGKNLYNGPIRTAFEVTYAPWKAGSGVTVQEKRVMTLDAGSPFTRAESRFEVKGTPTPQFAAGINTNPELNGIETTNVDPKAGYVAVWGTPSGKDGKDGIIGSALIVPNAKGKLDKDGNTYLFRPLKSNEPLVWYMGAMWSKASPVKSAEDWTEVVSRKARAVQTPLVVQMK